MNLVLLVAHLAVFPLFAGAVVYLCRHLRHGDRRMVTALIWAIALAACEAVAVIAGTAGPLSTPVVVQMVTMLTGVVPLSAAQWVSMYVGMLLGDHQTGYWTKTPLAAARLSPGAAVTLSFAAIVLFTYLLCRLFQVDSAPAALATEPRLRFALLLASCNYAVVEEIIYRGCFQALLAEWFRSARFGQPLALLVVAVVFTVQHVGAMNESFRVLQVLAAALLFGWIFRRYGLIAAISLHVLSNLTLDHIVPWLIRLHVF